MKRKALVVVLGDLARSPRMQYHCVSLANNNYDVTVIATGSEGKDKSCEELELNQNIEQRIISEVPDLKKYMPSILAYIIKPIWQSLLLVFCLLSIASRRINVIIVQNPPSIPTLPIMYLFSLLIRSKLIIDWHNYGFSILSLNLKLTHPLVRVSKTIEMFFGRLAHCGFCVSESMQRDLKENFHIKYPIYILYDRPPKHFKPLSLREKHNFFLKMKHQIPAFKSPTEDYFGSNPKTKFDRSETRYTISDVVNKNVIISKPKRPAIIMSSTSWTADEDFSMLLDALKRYDLTRTNQLVTEDLSSEAAKHCLPDLVCVITGKGPLKSYYEKKIKACKFEHIEIVLPWLTALDYPKMVASCDLGISLHSSSSGVDLPMKVVDMFGCGIPVLAFNYQAIGELVKDDFYGQTFRDSDELFTKLSLLLKDFYLEDVCSRDDIECSPLGRYRKNIKRRFLLSRWEDNWNREARPVL